MDESTEEMNEMKKIKEIADRIDNKTNNRYTFDFDESNEKGCNFVAKAGVKQSLNQKGKNISSRDDFFDELNNKIYNILEEAENNAQEDERDTVFPRDLGVDTE